MEINEIKKLLYKEKPMAELFYRSNFFKYYEAEIGNNLFIFRIPIEETEDFKDRYSAQLLIRWLYEFKEL